MTKNSVRERIICEIIRRLKAREFQTVAWDSVIRTEIPNDYDAAHGSLLAVLEGDEILSGNTSTRQNTLQLFVSYAVPLGAGEEAQAVANNAAAEIVQALNGSQKLIEGGDDTDGQALSAVFGAKLYETNLNDEMKNCGAGTVEFEMIYRTNPRNLFEAA